jgi:type IV pilus assembly protein PilV
MTAFARGTQRGFGLVESLVALLVVSVGMLGIAALYGQGLGASRSALFRTKAVNLVSDMADRIRANRQAGATYQAAGAGVNNRCEPGGATCTPAQMAAHDLWLWNVEIDEQLPGAAAAFGTVTHTAGVPPTFTILVEWQEIGVGLASYQVAIRVPDF